MTIWINKIEAAKTRMGLKSTQKRAAGQKLNESSQKRRTDHNDSWPDESPKKKRVGRSEKLPEKYEILSEFFNGLDTSIRLLRLRGLKPSFSNICPQIECLTDRRVTQCARPLTPEFDSLYTA
ncbi:hypothetical protein ACE6H2_022212 [Prunus campanulata]